MNEEYRLRHLVLQEFYARRTLQKTLKSIGQERTLDAATEALIREWYKRFQSGHLNIRDEDDPDYGKPLPIGGPGDYIPRNRALLFRSNDWLMERPLTTLDGRLGFTFRAEHTRPLVVLDFFHGKILDLPIERNPFRDYKGDTSFTLYLLDNEQLLLLEDLNHYVQGHSTGRVYLFHFRLCAMHCEFVYSAETSCAGELIFDQTDRERFGLFDDSLHYTFGRVDGRKISINTLRHDDALKRLLCKKLAKNRVCGLRRRDDKSYDSQFIEYDLVSRRVEKCIDVPATINHNPLDWSVYDAGAYVWSDDDLYFARERHIEDPGLYHFSAVTYAFSQLNSTTFGDVNSLHVGEDRSLTVTAMEYDHNLEQCGSIRWLYGVVYRFPLKNPDSLANLAWQSILFYRNFGASKVYEKAVARLPSKSRLRCLLPAR